MAVSVNGVTASTMNTVLTPLGSLNLRLEDSGEVKVGWCQVFSSWPISGLVIYQTVEGGKVISEATVYPSPRWKKTVVVAPQLGTNSDIGIAVANPWEYPVTFTMRLINSAGVVIDAVRCVKLALDRGISGPLIAPSSYFMKTPPKQFKDDIAHAMTEAYIRGEKV